MAVLPEDQKKAMRDATKEMAEAMLEDLEHFRAAVRRQNTSRSELRLLSTSLRRLLVNDELRKIASPRIGKLELSAPDYHPLHEVAAKAVEVQFSGGVGTRVFGQSIGPFSLMRFRDPPPFSHVEDHVRRLGTPTIPFEREKRISLRLNNFLTQKVICFKTVWISRGAIIKHVANLGSGAHSGNPETSEEKLISRLRSTCAYHLSDSGVEVRFSEIFSDPDWDLNIALGKNDETAATDEDFSSIDPALVELLTAAQLVSESPSVLRLEEVVRAERVPSRITRPSFPH